MDAPQRTVCLEARGLTISYAGRGQPAVNDVNLCIPDKRITAIIGPSGSGKSTLLRAFNRINELLTDVRTQGEVLFYGQNLLGRHMDPVELRRHIGMVFQKPNPFPKSIFENVAWGVRINNLVPRKEIPALVEDSLVRVGLWDEVKHRLKTSGLDLSGGQQQRLCIARVIAMRPKVILLDEPCSALDPVSTARIEDLLWDLRRQYTIIIVTHNLQQARRVSHRTAFMEDGKLIECGKTTVWATKGPKEQRTKEYLSGRFG